MFERAFRKGEKKGTERRRFEQTCADCMQRYCSSKVERRQNKFCIAVARDVVEGNTPIAVAHTCASKYCLRKNVLSREWGAKDLKRGFLSCRK